MMLPVVPLPVLIVLLAAAHRAGGAETTPLDRWVQSGLQSLQWEQLDQCLRMSLLSRTECRRLTRFQLSTIAIYMSEPHSAADDADKVVAILPESSYRSGGLISSKQHACFRTSPLENGLRGSHRRQHSTSSTVTPHDAVLVMDPHPGENFGHSVAMFYVDVNVTKKRCSHVNGVYLGDACLTPALKDHCQNQLKRWQIEPERFTGTRPENSDGTINNPVSGGRGLMERALGRFCEVQFLPLVVTVRDSRRTQRLRCVDHATFAKCPVSLPGGSPSFPVSSCELNKNTQRCHRHPVVTHLSCRLYQTCDHAVLISGGWQQQIIFQRHVQNLLKFYRMLQNNGFHKSHIQTFFSSNGLFPEELEGLYPATEKTLIRNHVSHICRKQHCADSLVLYLNSPTLSDGTMLLWDANLNGIADLKERYSVTELLADLAGCTATRVLVFVDQSYNGVLSKRLHGSEKHLNVVLIPTHTHHNHQNQNMAQEHSSWYFIRPETCLLEHLVKDLGTSHFQQPWTGLLNATLAGAPCKSTPPLTDGEMKHRYQGCQNLPTVVWHQKLRKTD
ncbi:uncharacterized protein si:ch211-67e16.11 [Thalassophryne amazonica]|uniref:uncharacterized protein si:ch211-67e16.11 n=1 Tax=Thalassophryne amazonica TaxID=390379 RepID=UPI001471063D|nr:uncharacterized protein si:ch211-67e16.11 [Thalassophryne amazonica]